jgi:hypothetical protein
MIESNSFLFSSVLHFVKFKNIYITRLYNSPGFALSVIRKVATCLERFESQHFVCFDVIRVIRIEIESCLERCFVSCNYPV